MPYKSEAQRRFFHTKTAKKEGITKDMVEEFDAASKRRHFVARVNARKAVSKKKKDK